MYQPNAGAIVSKCTEVWGRNEKRRPLQGRRISKTLGIRLFRPFRRVCRQWCSAGSSPAARAACCAAMSASIGLGRPFHQHQKA